MAKNITPRAKNFPEWYQDVINAGELADNSPTRGCIVFRPTGFALWEAIQAKLDQRFKETGHTNAYFPVLIPQQFLQKEQEHIEGFAPELAVVTHAGGKKLAEPLVVRPTSETIIGHMYAKWIKSYRDLPVLINQWANVLRWEKRPRMFLRTAEFLWQEGHTAHETAKEAEAESLQMLGIYQEFMEKTCAMPVITGVKPEHEKFPGAITTYTLEAMMQDKKALQAGTSHNFGQNFAKAFNIQFLDRQNQQAYAWTTSWGVSTRLIGGLIMIHGDDDGVIIPPALAPTAVVVVPIFSNAEEEAKIIPAAKQLIAELEGTVGKLRVKLDDSHHLRPSERFFYWVQRGIPLRIELGFRDIQNAGCVAVRRDNRQKTQLPLNQAASKVPEILNEIQQAMFQKAQSMVQNSSTEVGSYAEFKEVLAKQGGFIFANWDGTAETANKIQQETKATIRLLSTKPVDGPCIYTQQPAKHKALFAVAY